MPRVLEAKKRVHVDEGQVQTGAVAEEQLAGYPQLARLVREAEETCNGDSHVAVCVRGTTLDQIRRC